MEWSADLGFAGLIFVGVVPVGGHDGIAGVLVCRWLPRLSCRAGRSIGGDGQRSQPAESCSEVLGPGPGALNAEPTPALSAGEAGGDVQQPVAQRLRRRAL